MQAADDEAHVQTIPAKLAWTADLPYSDQADHHHNYINDECGVRTDD